MKSNPAKEKSVKSTENEAESGVGRKSRLHRKQTKQVRFLSNLRQSRPVLSASKSLVKKKRRRTREKAAKVLDNLASLAESLPSKEEVKASAETFHRRVLHSKSHQQIVVKETKQLASVLAHAEFQTNPFLAIQQHLMNTLPLAELPAPKQQQQKKKKNKVTNKRKSVEHMDE